MHFLLLHVPEEHVRLDGLGHKVRLPQQLAHGAGLGRVVIEQVIPGIQDAHNVVHVPVIDGEAAQSRVQNGSDNGFFAVVDIEAGYVRAVGHHIFGGAVVELEDVLDHFLFIFLNGAALAAHVHHGADLLFGDFLGLGVGVHAQQAQHAVGALAQQPHHRAEESRQGQDELAAHPRHALGLLHGDALGHQLAQHQGEVRKYQRNDNDAQGIEQLRIHGDARGQNGPGQHAGKVFRGKGAAQEARQGNAHLYGGEEAVGVFRQLHQQLGYPVALLRLTAYLYVIQGKHGDFRGSEVGIDGNENHLQQ